jgi:hypothetical protein
MKYRSEIDVVKLIEAAKAELRDSLPEAYKDIFPGWKICYEERPLGK